MTDARATIGAMRTWILTLLVGTAAWGQRDTLVSPEVHPDRRVTFRLRAPKATVITLRGDWMPASTREKLTKDESGVWSATLGPLAPDVYAYNFSIDGVAAIDPRNPEVMQGSRSSTESVLEVRGEFPLLHQLRDVPHGTVEYHWYKSKTLGVTRRFAVYTPPGYDARGSARYPALYLLHGSGDNEGTWVWFGRANLVLDNLLAEKKIRPMVVVMPFGHASPERGRNTTLFEQDLLEDVMPAAESAYRVAARPKNRAIAGLSMGGGQSAWVGLRHPERFGSIGVFSAGASNLEELEPHLAAAKEKLALFWMGCGDQDSGLPSAERLAAALEKSGVKRTFVKTPGAGHTWLLWRRYLAELAPLLFRE